MNERHSMRTLRDLPPRTIPKESPVLPKRVAAFIKRHRRIGLVLLGVEILGAIIISACGDAVSGPPPSELSVTKVGVVGGQTVTYIITVTNTASTASPGVEVSDVVSAAPVGSQFTSATGGSCTTTTATSYQCLVISISPGASRQLTLVLTVPPGLSGDIVNCASIPADTDDSNNQSCVSNTVIAVPNTGSITIVKDAQPNAPDDFTFTSSSAGIPQFLLDDDSDATLSNQKVFANLTPDSYTFTETQIAGWDLTGIVCVPAAGTTTSSATIALTAGANVTCTFTNKENVLFAP